MKTEEIQEFNGKRRSEVIIWLNSLCVELKMPAEASENELRDRLFDGTILISILKRIDPGFVESSRGYCSSSEWAVYFKRFLSVMDETGLPTFSIVDLQQGSMSSVVECLLSLRDHLCSKTTESGILDAINSTRHLTCRRKLSGEYESIDSDVEKENYFQGGHHDSFFMREGRPSSSGLELLHRFSPVYSETQAAFPHAGHAPEVFQVKQENFPSAKVSEVKKPNNIGNAPTKSLLGFINGILDKSIECKHEEIPQNVACLLKSAVQELGCRISTQSEHIRSQNNLIKSREDKYQSRIKVLEALANGTTEETKIIMNQLQLIKTQKLKLEEQKNLREHDIIQLTKEKESLKNIILNLKQEMNTKKEMYERHCMEIQNKSKNSEARLSEKIKEIEFLLVDSREKITDLEQNLELKCKIMNKKENIFQNFIHSELLLVQELGRTFKSLKEEALNTQTSLNNQLTELGLKLKVLEDVAENYNTVSAENRKLLDEIQELKGNIRVYCRIRPFLSGQTEKMSVISHIGENGELYVVNPSKQGKGVRMFKFNKVFGPSTSQAEIFSDIQPSIQSVLDGYSLCIFAYGQTGSGKTYTMSGPDSASMDDWGVNYRALRDLFEISASRRHMYTYEISVQMVEIYNEQVHDLLSDNDSMKRLGIWNATQPNGLAVPEASIHSVISAEDILQLMHAGLKNRAVGSTALNGTSSRSHSVLTVHVRSVDLKTGSASRGCLHLIDLAGSERVNRSEAIGDRLKETQHINKSLSALGDCIFALAKKSSHIPYRNSKLTQILQSSLGGHAKTVMFIQINPDSESYSETMSTLKFAERVSGVELGAACCNKDGRDVKDLLDQVASLKNVITRKDKEIEQLQAVKGLVIHSNISSINDSANCLIRPSSSPGIQSQLEATKAEHLSCGSYMSDVEKPVSVSEKGLGRSELNYKINTRDTSHSLHSLLHDAAVQDLTDVDSEDRLSNVSDGTFSLGTETDGSVSSAMENDFLPETNHRSGSTKEKKSKFPSQFFNPFLVKNDHATSTKLKYSDSSKSRSKKAGSSQITDSSPKSSKIWK